MTSRASEPAGGFWEVGDSSEWATRLMRQCPHVHPTGLLPQADAAGARRQRGRISSARLGLSSTTAVVPRRHTELAPPGAVR
jgi:hypothetical protein